PRADGHGLWAQTRIAALEALGRSEEAQAFRWRCFEAWLDAGMLREHLKRLPDFEDTEAETRALQLVPSSTRVHDALHFLVHWPDLARAADLVLTHAARIDGDD